MRTLQTIRWRQRGASTLQTLNDAIMEAVQGRKITLLKYEDMSDKMRGMIARSVAEEYKNATDHPEYQYFLREKFSIQL